MSIEDNKALVSRLYDLLGRKQFDAAYKYFDIVFVFHSSAGDLSLEQMKQLDRDFYSAFPDIEVNVEDMVAGDDKVSVRVNYRGTHLAAFIGISPTGRRIDITNANTLRIKAGKFVEGWNVTDIRLMQQLGAIPS